MYIIIAATYSFKTIHLFASIFSLRAAFAQGVDFPKSNGAFTVCTAFLKMD
ncbi:MAG TPA: hypothetical protein VEC36_10505 [Patescibacteria group bacterium]|nr:hypothetical protein [Patescibacteria group bacterium]